MTAKWDTAMIAEGHALVRACLRRNRPGLYLDLGGYHLFHATRADMLRRLGRPAQAAAAYEAAIARATNGAERAFLEQRRDSLRAAPPGAPAG